GPGAGGRSGVRAGLLGAGGRCAARRGPAAGKPDPDPGLRGRRPGSPGGRGGRGAVARRGLGAGGAGGRSPGALPSDVPRRRRAAGRLRPQPLPRHPDHRAAGRAGARGRLAETAPGGQRRHLGRGLPSPTAGLGLVAAGSRGAGPDGGVRHRLPGDHHGRPPQRPAPPGRGGHSPAGGRLAAGSAGPVPDRGRRPGPAGGAAGRRGRGAGGGPGAGGTAGRGARGGSPAGAGGRRPGHGTGHAAGRPAGRLGQPDGHHAGGDPVAGFPVMGLVAGTAGGGARGGHPGPAGRRRALPLRWLAGLAGGLLAALLPALAAAHLAGSYRAFLDNPREAARTLEAEIEDLGAEIAGLGAQAAEAQAADEAARERAVRTVRFYDAALTGLALHSVFGIGDVVELLAQLRALARSAEQDLAMLETFLALRQEALEATAQLEARQAALASRQALIPLFLRADEERRAFRAAHPDPVQLEQALQAEWMRQAPAALALLQHVQERFRDGAALFREEPGGWRWIV